MRERERERKVQKGDISSRVSALISRRRSSSLSQEYFPSLLKLKWKKLRRRELKKERTRKRKKNERERE